MARHPVRKGLVGLATVFSFLVLSAVQPVGAAEIEGGTLYVGSLTFPLGDQPVPAPCESNPNIDPFDFGYDDEREHWWVDGGFTSTAQVLGSWLKAEFDLSVISGTATPDPTPPLGHTHTILDGGGSIEVKVYDLSWDPEEPEPRECVKGELVCTITVDVVIDDPSYHHELPLPEYLFFNASSVNPHVQIDIAECDFLIWLALSGQPALLEDLVISLP